jgi:predicted flap endonuclease-1-like 5' DNA nuclease
MIRLINEGAPMTYPTSDLDGITQDQIKLLKSLGIRTTERLLDAACTARRRKLLATKTGVPEQRWLSWANNADRMRIKGVGQDNAKLLQEAGVVTVRELRYRNPAHLAQAMRELNGTHKLMRLPPTERAIKRWIEAAKKLDSKIKY